ncbi:MAG: GTP-binding protein, partial [Bacilli bacterium]
MNNNKIVLTLGIFAHANAGKTTITEHLLYHTGVIKSLGRVDAGNTVTDNLKAEKKRGITIRDTLVSFEFSGKTIQLIDTPGHIDFSAEVERAINVLDGAILVVSGVEGLEAQTFTIWRALQKKKIPVIIFINKMDRKGANYKRVLGELHKFLNIPTLTLIHVYQDNDGSLKIIPSSLEDLIEEASIVDNEILEHYINNKEVNNKFIEDRIIKLTKDCKLFPVIGGSALKDIGIEDLIECIGRYIPISIKNIDIPLSAFVYTIRVDETGKNAYVKILSGSINL